MSDSSENILRIHMKVLQQQLPFVEEPFAGFARQLDISQDELMGLLKYYLKKGTVRRVAGVLKHNRAGFSSNGMVALEVDSDECDRAGETLAKFPFITHCYRRTAYPDWPYTIYAMVHARDNGEFDRHLEKIRSTVNHHAFTVLRSVKEYKKTAFRME
jgi:DNA-binding Lrp family transcriptional regulator